MPPRANVHVSGLPTEPFTWDEIRTLAQLVLQEEGYPDDTEVAFSLVDDEEMAQWNQRALGREAPTDVLAFPLEELTPGAPPVVTTGGPPTLLGDVVIAPDYVCRQAAATQTPVEDELALMVVHGLLHLMGYDHLDDEDAELMEERERSILALAGRVRR